MEKINLEKLKADYDYLHNLPLEGWLWEFIRRNGEYLRIYGELKRDISEEDLKQTQKAQFSWSEIKFSSRPITDNFEQLEKGFGICPNLYFQHLAESRQLDSDTYFCKKIQGKEYVVSIPNPEKKYDEIKPKLRITGSTPILTYKFKENVVKELLEGDKQKFYEQCYRAINRLSPNSDIQNTLYIGISLNAKKEELKESFEEIIKNIKLDTRDRRGKWFFYIIVYDLVEIGNYSYPKITEILQQAFPKMKKKNNQSLFDEKTIFNWSAKAHDLILDKFRNFASLK